MAFSVGIGLTNECNLRCAHCALPFLGLYATGFLTVGIQTIRHSRSS